MTARIFFKLILGVLCILVVALFAVDVLASRIAESNYRETLTRELEQKSRMLAILLTVDGTAKSAATVRDLARAAGGRLTVVAPDGRVLADSEANPAGMENHRHRPEIKSALKGKSGSSIRQSPTIGHGFLYVAVPCGQGALRLAVPMVTMAAQVNAIRKRLLFSTVLAFLPAIFLAAFFARHVSYKLGRVIHYAGELARGNFRARLEATGTDELGILGGKLNETGEKLQKMFEALQREHQEMEKLELIRKDFVINVSHELRTPLASIQGYTETLLNGAINDPRHNLRFLEIIRQNAERLTNLASDLLTLSRIEMKMQRFQFASYYVNTLLRDSVDSIRPLADKKRILLHLECTAENAEIFCDAKVVHQALGNLLDNAIKYTPDGGHIFIGARPAETSTAAAEFYELYVRDTGSGIPAEDLPRLFERFYRVDKARSRELGGTGLGLAIVKHIARAHGGDVHVETELSKGSTFSFTLPVQDPGLAEHLELQSKFTAS